MNLSTEKTLQNMVDSMRRAAFLASFSYFTIVIIEIGALTTYAYFFGGYVGFLMVVALGLTTTVFLVILFWVSNMSEAILNSVNEEVKRILKAGEENK